MRLRTPQSSHARFLKSREGSRVYTYDYTAIFVIDDGESSVEQHRLCSASHGATGANWRSNAIQTLASVSKLSGAITNTNTTKVQFPFCCLCASGATFRIASINKAQTYTNTPFRPNWCLRRPVQLVHLAVRTMHEWVTATDTDLTRGVTRVTPRGWWVNQEMWPLNLLLTSNGGQASRCC